MTEQSKAGSGEARSPAAAPSAIGPETGATERQLRARRRSRRPFGSRDQRLAHPPDPRFHFHWFNDEPGRLHQAEEAGYDFVTDPEGKKLSYNVGTNRAGGPQIAYLMRIPQEWYEEDQAALQKIVDRTDHAIRRGAVQGAQKPEDQDQFYAEAQGRRIQMTEGSGHPMT